MNYIKAFFLLILLFNCALGCASQNEPTLNVTPTNTEIFSQGQSNNDKNPSCCTVPECCSLFYSECTASNCRKWFGCDKECCSRDCKKSLVSCCWCWTCCFPCCETWCKKNS
jgi:hypothetical protein